MTDLHDATVQAVKSAMEWWDEDVHGDLEVYIANCAVDAVRDNADIEAAVEAMADALHHIVVLPGRSRLVPAAKATVDAAFGDVAPLRRSDP